MRSYLLIYLIIPFYIIKTMKSANKEPNQISVTCKDHKEKCAFVCLFKSCKDAFKLGCIKCRKDHSQHPNRLISIGDFHSMLSKPIRYLQNLTAYKLMNLKKKIEYIRNFRTEILQKEVKLMDSNRNIKLTISSILHQHYGITEVVSHLDSEALATKQEEYAQQLQRCKDFLAYNPVKCELVFNNQVIKNSRIQLEKHLKTSQELIDSIREFLIKIIEVLLANCTHDEDDDEIQYAQEGDSPTTFNIFIKNKKDAIQNPNIKNKIEHQTFLEMFDEQKQALSKQVQFLQREIDTKSKILKKIKSSRQQQKEDSVISEKSEKEQSSRKQISLQVYEQLQMKNKLLNQQINKLKSLSNYEQIKGKDQFDKIIKQQLDQIRTLTERCSNLELNIGALQENLKNEKSQKQLSRNQMKKYYNELLKQKETINNLLNSMKDMQLKINELTSSLSKQNADYSSLSKKYASLQGDNNKRKLELEAQRQAAKSTQEDLSKKYSETCNKLSKKQEQLQRRQKDVQRERKKYADLQKLVEKLKQNSASIEKQSQKWRDQYQAREKYMRNQLQKTQKEVESLKYKSRNEEERNKNIESKMKELAKEIQCKNEIIREKEKIIRQKEQSFQNKITLHNSRVKDLQIELKTSRSNENTKGYEEEWKKHKQTKELLEMSIKRNQELKDRNYELETLLIQHQNKTLKVYEQSKKQTFASEIMESKFKSSTNNFLGSEKLRIETVTSEELTQSQNRALKQQKLVDSNQRKQAYLQIKSLFKAVTQDMGILQERLKENSVIQKVYLKELERKRNENKLLKKELENTKLYGTNCKQQPENGLNLSLKPTVEKEKKQIETLSSITPKGEIGSPLRKIQKTNTKKGQY